MKWSTTTESITIQEKKGSTNEKFAWPILALGRRAQVVGFDVLPKSLGHLGR
jgi:hypothetical protein